MQGRFRECDSVDDVLSQGPAQAGPSWFCYALIEHESGATASEFGHGDTR